MGATRPTHYVLVLQFANPLQLRGLHVLFTASHWRREGGREGKRGGARRRKIEGGREEEGGGVEGQGEWEGEKRERGWREGEEREGEGEGKDRVEGGVNQSFYIQF